MPAEKGTSPNGPRQVPAFREAQGLTLKDISARCGMDVATLSKLENGKQATPTLFTMLLYIGAVGKRLHFSVRPRPQPTLQVSEVRDTNSKRGTDRTAQPGRRKAKARKAKLAG